VSLVYTLPVIPSFRCGHLKTDLNTYVNPSGAAFCRACRRDRARTDQQDRREQYRALIREARERPCVDCGIDWLPASVMHLDHVRGEKVRNVANGSGFSLRTLVAELAKCEVRCPNCHAVRHYEEEQRAAV
jgi:hypothetical protein